jgi:hypothetical protein
LNDKGRLLPLEIRRLLSHKKTTPISQEKTTFVPKFKSSFKNRKMNRKSNRLTLSFGMSVLLSLVVGCSSPCDDVACLNGGDCNKGTCVCTNGYTGTNCEIAPDPCANVTCLNGGICIEGVCDCPSGYEGTNCQTLSRAKFLGNYSTTEVCPSGSANITVSVTALANDVTKVGINGGGIYADGTVSGNTITIPNQFIGAGSENIVISGQGTYNASASPTTTITCTVSYPTGVCTYICTK